MTAIQQSSDAYEAWLHDQIGPGFVKDDLDEKHKKMGKSPFSFLRATFWRWAESILDYCPALADAPKLLGIGDVHLENFGTWRDAEGRLVWGVNDFDEAATLPYALDLVRLATSALLASKRADPAEVCRAILVGYRRGLRKPAPVVIERRNKRLRAAILPPEKSRPAFWDEFWQLPNGPAPAAIESVLHASLPDPAFAFSTAPRTGVGTGSLGRPRFIARTVWQGEPILREAKVLVPSAWCRVHDPSDLRIRAFEIANGPFRAPDPNYRVDGSVVVRRLSPDNRKIEVEKSAKTLLAPDMLEAMGFEIANCHAADPERIDAVREDLAKRKKNWLVLAAKSAAGGVLRDQQDYARTSKPARRR